MNWTRMSLFYLAGYLAFTGIALLLAPDFTLNLLKAHRGYDGIFVRFTGAFMIAVSAIVVQVIRFRIEALYPTTIAVRIFFIVCILWLYSLTGDPVFFVFLGVVALGFVLTTTAFLVDRAKKPR